MNFVEFYEKNDIINIPLYFDCIEINEETKTLETYIPYKMFPYLVDNGVIILKKDNKTFKNMNEAIHYYKKNILKENENDTEDAVVFDPSERDEIMKSKVKSDIKWVDDEGKEFDFEYSLGNVKVGSDTIIVNMSTATNCMSLKLGLCPLGSSGKCYALNPEIRYVAVRKYRERQAKQWHCMTPNAMGEAFIAISNHDKSIKFVRLNESGEFRGPDDIDKLKKIAAYVKNKNSSLIFYTYTHRTDLFKDGESSNMGDNVVINGSNFMVDNAFKSVEYPDYMEVVRKLKDRRTRFCNGEKVISKERITECVGSCAVCDKCKVKRKQFIYIPIHGARSKYEMYKRKTRNAFIKNPQINEIIKSNKSKEEKMEAIVFLLTPDQKIDLDILLTTVADRKEFWDILISDEEMKENLLKAIYDYVDLKNPVLNVDDENIPSHQSQVQADKASMEAFVGKLKSEVERAQSEGLRATEDLYQKAIKSIEKAITNIKFNMTQPKKLKTVRIGKFPATKFKKWLSWRNRMED